MSDSREFEKNEGVCLLGQSGCVMVTTNELLLSFNSYIWQLSLLFITQQRNQPKLVSTNINKLKKMSDGLIILFDVRPTVPGRPRLHPRLPFQALWEFGCLQFSVLRRETSEYPYELPVWRCKIALTSSGVSSFSPWSEFHCCPDQLLSTGCTLLHLFCLLHPPDAVLFPLYLTFSC